MPTHLHMLGKMSFLIEGLSAFRADVTALSGVPHEVLLQQLASAELLAAYVAGLRLLTTVQSQMSAELALHSEDRIAQFAHVLRLVAMRMRVVNVELVAVAERARTETARVGLLSGRLDARGGGL